MHHNLPKLPQILRHPRSPLVFKVVTLTVLSLSVPLLLYRQGVAQQSLPLRIERWLMLRQLTGQVMYQHRDQSRPAQSGDRLRQVGDGVTTGPRSTATIEVDTGIGFLRVAEKTQVTVRQLMIAGDNGRITQLNVPWGQVRLQLRRFTHRGSSLQIHTPAGVSAVRGTEFGVNVQPSGKMGVATLTGKVVTQSKGRTVAVPAGFQNLTIPGEAPSAPVPLKDSTELRYSLQRQIQGKLRQVRFIGQIDPVNTVYFRNTPLNSDRRGQFSLLLPPISTQDLEFTVITPLGRQQVHKIKISL